MDWHVDTGTNIWALPASRHRFGCSTWPAVGEPGALRGLRRRTVAAMGTSLTPSVGAGW